MTFCTFCPLYAILGRFGEENSKQTTVKTRKMAEKFTAKSSGRSLRNVSLVTRVARYFSFKMAISAG